MKCLYCDAEMEKGNISVYVKNVLTPVTQRYTSDEEMSKKGIKAAISRKSINLENSNDAWYCKNCKKVIGVFKESD